MTSPETNVLVVEDDPAMLRFIRRTLEVDGHNVVTATDGLAALDQFQREMPHLVVLDIGIPHIDGLEVCRQMQAIYPVPVIIVTAQGEDQDIIRGFEVGAGDYLAKPFAGGVLAARVRSLLRRNQSWAGPNGHRIECGDLVIDLASRNVTHCGDDVHLTPTEYKLLALLGRFYGKVITIQQIFAEVWGADHGVDPQMLRTHISRLRKKIDPVWASANLLQTVPGVGYRLRHVTPET